MVMRAVLATLAVLVASTDAILVTFKNTCAHPIDLFYTADQHKEDLGLVAVGASYVKDVPVGTGPHTFRHTKSARATLAEFSFKNGAWYDISIIPPGADYCPSFGRCIELSGGNGYNVPMQIVPIVPKEPNSCPVRTCMHDGCPDGYLFPKDDDKTKSCNINLPGYKYIPKENLSFEVIFCPGGNVPPAPTPTPAPTPAPTPEPTTVEPTPEPSSAAGSTGNDEGSLRGSGEAADEAGLIETEAPVATTEAPAVGVPIGGAEEENVQDANTQSEASSGGSAGYVIIGVVGAVAMVAAAAIIVVRKKKAELEALDLKTPDQRMTLTMAGSRGTQMRTPQNFIDVL